MLLLINVAITTPLALYISIFLYKNQKTIPGLVNAPNAIILPMHFQFQVKIKTSETLVPLIKIGYDDYTHSHLLLHLQ